jgi:hypothetical protein
LAEKPTAAFVLSLIGGIFILLVGALIAAVFATLGGLLGGFGLGDFGMGMALLGTVGLIVGLIIIVAAAMLYMRPQQHVIWGVLILILAIVSIPFAFGGFIIGFILALVGGILGIVFKPQAPMAAPYAPPMAPPPQ